MKNLLKFCLVEIKSSQNSLCLLKALPQGAVNEAESNTETPTTEFQVTVEAPDKMI